MFLPTPFLNMLDWLELLPPYLLYLALFLIVLPTMAAALLRLSLYSYLSDAANKVTRLLVPGKSRGQQPRIVDELETRYKQAIKHLEQINTAALIDGVYSQEKFRCFGLSLCCEQWDYFCKVLPNLLLSFGLLGTFIGITLNLYNLSQTINQADGDISNLVQQLQTPLQSMGIAFVTSLIALVCSSVLIFINLSCNTNLAKSLLIYSLEDYLDNVFKPQKQGDTRLDKAVNRMAEQQHEFLERFHENVTAAVESSLGRVAKQFADGNKEATDLAKQVYEQLVETSGTIATGADTFKTTALFLDKQIQRLDDIVQHSNFVEYSTALESSTNSIRVAAEKIEQSHFADCLISATKDLETTCANFARSTTDLGQATQSMELAIAALQSSEQKTTDLGDRISDLNQDSLALINSSQSLLAENKDGLSQIHYDLIDLIKTLKEREAQINLELQKLGDRFSSSVKKQTNSNTQLQKIAHDVEQSLQLYAEKVAAASKYLENTYGGFTRSTSVSNQKIPSTNSASATIKTQIKNGQNKRSR